MRPQLLPRPSPVLRPFSQVPDPWPPRGADTATGPTGLSTSSPGSPGPSRPRTLTRRDHGAPRRPAPSLRHASPVQPRLRLLAHDTPQKACLRPRGAPCASSAVPRTCPESPVQTLESQDQGRASLTERSSWCPAHRRHHDASNCVTSAWPWRRGVPECTQGLSRTQGGLHGLSWEGTLCCLGRQQGHRLLLGHPVTRAPWLSRTFPWLTPRAQGCR